MIVRVPTRLGTLTLEWEGERLERLGLPGSAEAPADGGDGAGTAIPAELPGWVQALVRDLAAYAEGRSVDLTRWVSRVDLSRQPPFRRSVYAALLRIPRGATCTYGQLAAAAGSPGAARAVGNAMAANEVPLVIPCHRVVAVRGLGDYGGGLELKRRLLALEGAVAYG